MTEQDARSRSVIGAGLMGHGIALVLAGRPGVVWLHDTNQDTLDRSLVRIRGALELLKRNDLVSEDDAEKILERIRPTTDLATAVSSSWFIIEAVIENLDLKRDLFAELEKLAPGDAILATNTSSYTLAQVGEKVERKGRLVGSHFFMPAQFVPLVEVSRNEFTRDEAFERTVELWESCGKAPIRVQKDVPGYVANRLQSALAREAVDLLEQGVTSPEDIDRAVCLGFGLRFLVSGPLEQKDLSGIAIHFKVMEETYPNLCRTTKPNKFYKEMVERGDDGIYTGRGFFDWSGQDAETVRRSREEKLIASMARLGFWRKPMD